MRFLGSKFTQNALALPAAGAKALPQTPCRFQGKRQGKGKGGERGRRERGKGVLGKGKRERREEEREGEGKEEGKEGEGEFASLALGGIDAPANIDINHHLFRDA